MSSLLHERKKNQKKKKKNLSNEEEEEEENREEKKRVQVAVLGTVQGLGRNSRWRKMAQNLQLGCSGFFVKKKVWAIREREVDGQNRFLSDLF